MIVIFQPEIRTILEQLGRNQLLGRHKVLTVDEREHLVYEMINAIDYLRKERIGALIVIERDISLGNYIDKAKKYPPAYFLLLAQKDSLENANDLHDAIFDTKLRNEQKLIFQKIYNDIDSKL